MRACATRLHFFSLSDGTRHARCCCALARRPAGRRGTCRRRESAAPKRRDGTGRRRGRRAPPPPQAGRPRGRRHRPRRMPRAASPPPTRRRGPAARARGRVLPVAADPWSKKGSRGGGGGGAEKRTGDRPALRSPPPCWSPVLFSAPAAPPQPRERERVLARLYVPAGPSVVSRPGGDGWPCCTAMDGCVQREFPLEGGASLSLGQHARLPLLADQSTCQGASRALWRPGQRVASVSHPLAAVPLHWGEARRPPRLGRGRSVHADRALRSVGWGSYTASRAATPPRAATSPSVPPRARPGRRSARQSRRGAAARSGGRRLFPDHGWGPPRRAPAGHPPARVRLARGGGVPPHGPRLAVTWRCI